VKTATHGRRKQTIINVEHEISVLLVARVDESGGYASAKHAWKHDGNAIAEKLKHANA
jgi:hypothetical protein